MKLLSRIFGATAEASLAIGNDEPIVEATDDGLRSEADTETADQRASQSGLAKLLSDGTVDLASIVDPRQIDALVVSGATSRQRQLAAATVRDPQQLRELLKQVRTKDKNVYKILKSKLDALQAKDREAAQIVEEIDAISAALDRHSRRTFDPLYAGVFQHHYHRWLELKTKPDVEQVHRADEAIARCQAVIAERARQDALQVQERAALLATREAQRAALEIAEVEAAAKAKADALARDAAAAERQLEEAAHARRLAAEDQRLRQVGGLLRKTQSALADGHSQAAAGLRRAIEEKLSAAASVPGNLAKGLQQLDQRLNELKEWKSFAVAPKRIELIRDMESLNGSSAEPKLLAERIKSLQEDWKTTCKGIVSDEGSADWERFHRASQAAYQPCKDYFAAQAKQRLENVTQRQAVLERVKAFESGLSVGTVDWRLVASVLREAPLEWRAHSPVERELGRILQADFDASMRRLQAILDTVHQRNIADKQGLIQRAQHLLTLDHPREATEGVKRLQALWKETGPASRDREQPLWQEFRGHCDAVFQKRQQAQMDHASGLEANKTQAEALCAQIEQAVQESGAALAEGLSKISGWRTAFEKLGELPRADVRRLQRRFEQAVVNVETRAAHQRARDVQKFHTDVFEAASQIRACEWAAMQGEPEARRLALRQQAEESLAATKRGPAGTQQAMKEALAKAESVTAVEVEAREKALRILCIRGEILSDTATPVEEESLRRNYQVQRLVHGLGQGIAADRDWNVLLLEWIRVSAIAPPVHERLQARFMSCWLKHGIGGDGAGEPTRRTRHESRAP